MGWTRRGRPRCRSLTAAAAVLLVVTACAQEISPPVQIRIATGSPTAVYFAVGQSLAAILNRELPGARASVVVTAASEENVSLVTSGQAELGFTQADILSAGPSTAGLTAVARVYDDLLHLVTLVKKPIRQLSDLRGRRVAIGAPGSGTAVTANRLLVVVGLAGGGTETVRLGIDDSVAALLSGEIDAFFFSGGLPVKAIADLAARDSIRFVDLGQRVEPLRRAYSEVYVGRDIPTSAYGVAAVTTVAVPNYLVVARSLPEKVAFDVTRLLMQRRDELSAAHPAAARVNPQMAITTVPLDLHPGAARYYRSRKP
jgi:TRAP transporter TAXI family solute receptor